MNYNLVQNIIELIAQFELSNSKNQYLNNVEGFKQWIVNSYDEKRIINETNWESKAIGRSAESVISTLLTHLGRYAKSYSKAAIIDSEFSTQEEFIYLITLKSFGKMTKMDLIKKNVHEKPAGVLIINRLMENRWIQQENSTIDKRSKLINITEKGLQVLSRQMDKIRKATKIVSGNLTENEKLELIYLLNKLNDFHLDIYNKNIDRQHLLNEALILSK
ncbi:winged helix DNA-binding protein [Rhizosphaericola mali]|uniref:Winged helix DNA-binding protein n=1 Tax=Rhizosphaericola mali TaxID=2545455 RepID=A0A5P2G535_9BACT|nr:winged helix DNA-binding protein [Rhizosphaericola mali]